ncbi:MAG TPA: hypothetical protein VK968_14445 [Roseimicrobium sp.]|nr:hypothetical protein [Roseimicrobium sp.]
MSEPQTAAAKITACPQCGSDKVRWRSSKTAVTGSGIFFAATGIGWIAVKKKPDLDGTGGWAFALPLFCAFALATVLSSSISHFFGKSLCKKCGHKWK